MFTDIVLAPRADGFDRMASRLGIRVLYTDGYRMVNGPKDVKGGGLLVGGPSRTWIDHPLVKIVTGFEGVHAKDSMHYRRGGLAEGDLTALHDKEKIVAFDFSAMLLGGAVHLGRVSQNIVLLRKAKVEWIIASFARTSYGMRSSRDYECLLRVLGARGDEAKRAVTLLSSLLGKQDL
ncbi:MAG: hypothetical protein ABIH41_07240 [Nanoarchaeota archaeon]